MRKCPYGLFFCAALAAGLLSSCGSWYTAPRALRTDGPRPTDYGEATGTRAMVGARPKVCDTGPEIRKMMLKLIESANDYILIDSFLTLCDPVTEDVLQALARKHREGVRIYILADSSSRFIPESESAYDFFEAAGIECVEYNPLRVYKLVAAPVMLPRDHRKFWIVDGSVLFLGGANIAHMSLKPAQKNGNRDFMVAVESPEAIEEMVESFVATWNRCSPHQLRPGDFPAPRGRAGETRFWLVDQNGDAGHSGTVETMFSALFAMATEEVWLVQAYAFVTPGILARIREVTNRGVQVHVMLSARVLAPRFHYASHYGIKDLLEAGARVWIWEAEQGAVHAKAMVVDRRLVSVGSANLNHRSFTLSKEANLVFDDPDAVRQVLRTLDDLRRNCRPVDRKEAEHYRTPAYYFAWLWMQLTG